MLNYNSTLQSNNTDLQAILNQINELPEAGGVDLPTLTNEGSASDLLSGKQLIDGNGNKITGSFTIDTELAAQDNLISQIQAAVDSLPEAGGSEPNLQTKTVTPTTSSQNVVPDSGYDGLSKVTVNAMPTATQATPSISVSSSGLITASATQTAGYVSAGTKSGTKQLTTKAATTYTPSTSNQTIATGTYLTGVQTIKGDANLKAENIVSGKTIFGVTGTASSGGSSGGGSVEMCTGTVIIDAPLSGTITIWAVNENLQVSTFELDMMGGTFTAAKGTIVAINEWSTYSIESGGCTRCFGSFDGAAFIITDDFTLTYMG